MHYYNAKDQANCRAKDYANCRGHRGPGRFTLDLGDSLQKNMEPKKDEIFTLFS